MLELGVMISGSGTNLQAIIDAIDAGELDAHVALVVSSNPDAYGIERARRAGIDCLVMERSEYDDPDEADRRIAQALLDKKVELVAMAGYMRMVGEPLLTAFPDRVVNLHPALLPSFPGAHGISDAFEYGVKVTGITVHLATAEMDAGPIIAQRAVEVREDDSLETLEERVHLVEHELYPKAIQLFAQGRVSVGQDRKVHIL